MTNRSMLRRLAAFAMACALAVGCAPPPVLVAVHTVPTSTPGVRYVVVHPAVDGQKVHAKDGEGRLVNGNSEYILYCDGRGADGMTCILAPEVGAKRASNAAAPVKPGKPVEEAVGVFDRSTLSITEIDRTTGAEKKAPPPPAASSAPPPAPAPAATSAPLPPTEPPPAPPPPPPSPSRKKGRSS